MARKRPRPVRPTVAPGVPTPIAWSGPSRSLQATASQIGRDRALSEFYKAIVQEQWDYDDDYRDDFYTARTDRRRHRQAVDLQDHREYLKGDKGSGLGNQSYASSTLKEVTKSDDAADAAAEKLTGGGIFDTMAAMMRMNDDNDLSESTTVAAKREEAATKKAEQDEAESGWWHDLKETVSDAIPDPVKAVAGEAADAGQWVADTAVGEAVGDAGAWAFDKLSRPGHAMAGAAKAFYGLDDDEGSIADVPGLNLSGDLMRTMNFFGQNPAESLDDLDWEGIKKVGAGFWGGLSGKDHETFSDVIRSNSERNLSHNMYDSLTYQVAGGLAGDLAIDPLNLVGVGLVKNVATAPLRGARAIQEANRATKIREVAEEAAAIGVRKIGPARQGEDYTYSADELVGMLSGKYQKKSDRIADVRRIQSNAGMIAAQVSGQKTNMATSTRLKNIEAQAAKVATRLAKVKNDHVSETLIDDVITDFAKREETGAAPVGTTKKIETRIHNSKIQAAFKSTRGFIKGDYDKQKSVRLERFNKAMGEEYMTHPALTDKDRAEIFESIHTLKGLKNHPEPAIRQLAYATSQNAADLRSAKKRGDKKAIETAQRKLANSNRVIDELRPQVFRQMVDARVKKNANGAHYSDPERAAVLEDIVARAEAELASRNITPRKWDEKRTIEHDSDMSGTEGSLVGTSTDEGLADAAGKPLANKAGNKAKPGPQKGEFEVKPDAVPDAGKSDNYNRNMDELDGDPTLSDWAEPDLSDAAMAFEANTAFSSYDAQLQATYTAAERELRGLASDYGDLDSTPLRVPEELLDGDGKLTKENLRNYFTVSDEDKVDIAVKPGIPEGPVKAWLETAARKINLLAQSHFRKLNADEASRLQEVDEAKNLTRLTVEQLREDAQLKGEKGDEARLVMKMFGSTENIENLKGTDWANKNLDPIVTVDDVRISRTKRAALSEHVKKQDRDASERMKRYLTHPDKLDHRQKRWVVEQLAAHDIGVVTTLKGVQDYLERHRSTLVEAFTPEQMAFKRLFDNEHGMTLGDAMLVRSKVLGNTLTSPSKAWTKAFPNGISKSEFIRIMTDPNAASLIDKMTDGFPGYITRGKDKQLTPNGKEELVDAKTVAGIPFSGSKGGKTTSPGWKHVFTQDIEVINSALKSVGLPVGTSFDDVRKAWLKDFKDYVKTAEPEELRTHLGKIFTDAQKRSKVDKERRAKELEKKSETKNYYEGIDYAKNAEKARKYAVGEVVANANRGNHLQGDSGYLNLPSPAEHAKVVEDAVKAVHDEQVNGVKQELGAAKAEGNVEDVKALEARLEQLKKEWQAERDSLHKKAKEAAESSKLLEKRIKEAAILSIADAQIAGQSRMLSLNMAGHAMNIPGTRQMFAAAEKAGSLPVIRKFSQVFSDAFASQRKALPEEMQLIANRALSNPAEVISYHVRDIKQSLGQVPMKVRQTAMRGYLTGSGAGSKAAMEMIDEKFNALLPYFQNKVEVAGGPLRISDINNFLPDKFKFKGTGVNRFEIKSARDLAGLLEQNILVNGGKKSNVDPIELIWATRIAAEQAMARKAMVHAVNETFGVKRGYRTRIDTGRVIPGQKLHQGAEAVEQLQKYGWSTLSDMGHSHYFPEDSVKDIARLMTMFEPKNAGRVGQFVDEVTGIWKTMVTIYNVPGYYVRNGIGETMSAWLGGVNDARVYKKAHDVIRFTKHEGDKVEALREHMPALAHMLKGETNSELGRKVVARRRNGQQLSAERVAVLYQDQGLKSGFINTEYRHHYSKTKEKFRNVPGIKQAGNFNEGLRAKNENFEDFFRMGHFIDKLNKAPANLSEKAAAEWAAKEVRKYHFDYTDFTRTEKVTMLRVFPFYKWTRKALPLMASMMFVKPGKMMAYPKIMNSVSEGLVGTEDLDPDEDQSYMPNYQNIAPSFVQDLWAYQVAGPTDPDEKGTTSYARAATPQMDALNAIGNPTGQAYNLLNPMLKLPFEQLEGETKGTMNLPIESGEDRLGHVLRTTPQGGALANIMGGNMDGDNLIRLLTGLGYYNVTDEGRNFAKFQQGSE